MFKNWIFWLVFLVGWNVLLLVTQKLASTKWPRQLKILDLNLPLLFCALHFLSSDLLGLSLLPFLVFALGLFGIAMTLTYVFFEGDIIYSAFFVRYLRVADMLALVAYLILLVLQFVRVVGNMI